MFGAFIKETQGYLSKATLVAAFFPSLLFWLAGAVLLNAASCGVASAISAWEKLGTIWQYGLLTTFLTGVTLCALLLAAVQPALVSWLSGYWPMSPIWRRLEERGKRRWTARFDALDKADRQAEQRELAVLQPTPQGEGHPAPAGPAQTKERERRDLSYRLFRRFTQERAEIMPTELGNILRSAELHPRDRYGFDGVVIWPRLQFLLPKEFADQMEACQTSLFLFCTLTCLTAAFVLPLLWVGMRLGDQELSSPWLLALGAATLSLWLFRLRVRWFLVLPGAALVGALLSLHIAPRAVQGFLWSALLCGGACNLAHLFYRVATHAALVYGDKLRAAFDLYRFKLLEQLQMRTPTSLLEERAMWQEIGGLLYRGYDVDDALYQYVRGPQSRERMLQIPVPHRCIAAQELITQDALMTITLPESSLTSDTICEGDKLIGQLAQRPLLPRRPIIAGSTCAPVLLEGRSQIGIPLPSASVLGINLRAGDVVSVILSTAPPAGAPAGSPPKLTTFTEILVLDVSRDRESADKATPFVISLALPETELRAFIAALPGATIYVTRPPRPALEG